MWENIKKYAVAAYGFIIAGLLAVIYALTQKNNNLKSKNTELSTELTVKEQLHKLQAQKEKADAAENDYRTTRDEYTKSHPSEGSDDNEF